MRAISQSLFRLAPAAATVAGSLHAAGIYLKTLDNANFIGTTTADYASGPGISIFNSGGLNSSVPSGGTINPTSMSLGLTNGTLSTSFTSGGVQANSSASASLDSGTLRAFVATDSNAGTNGTALAQFVDTLHFSVAGGGSAQITVVIHEHGSVTLPTGGSNFLNSFVLNFDFASLSFGSDQNGFFSSPVLWNSSSITNQSNTGFDFVGVYTVIDGGALNLAMQLQVNAGAGATADFSHTSAIS